MKIYMKNTLVDVDFAPSKKDKYTVNTLMGQLHP